MTVSACGGGDDGTAAPTPPASVSVVTVTLAAGSVAVGQSQTVSAQAKDANGAVLSGVSFTWASSDNSVATVRDGTATGVAAGSARITASAGGVTSDPVTLRQGDAQGALPRVRIALGLAASYQPDVVYFAEIGQVAHQVLTANSESGAAVLRDTVDWIQHTAARHVPTEFRDSFMHRNPVNHELLAAASRLAPGDALLP